MTSPLRDPITLTAAVDAPDRRKDAPMSDRTEFEGKLVQLDYRDDGSIQALHLQDAHGVALLVTIDLPAEPLEEIRLGQQHAMFMEGTPTPTVRIERA